MTSACVTKALDKHRAAIGAEEMAAITKDALAITGQTEAKKFGDRAEVYLKHYQKERSDITSELRTRFPKETTNASQAAETPVSAVQEETQPEQSLQAREDALKSKLQTIIDDRAAPKAKKRAAAAQLDLLTGELNATTEDRENNLALVEKQMSDEQTTAEDRAAGVMPVLPPNKGWLTNFSKTTPNTPEDRTTIQKIQAALRSWFISPEQAASRLVVVQKWEDLSQAIRDRVAEAQKSTYKYAVDGKSTIIEVKGKPLEITYNPSESQQRAMMARAAKNQAQSADPEWAIIGKTVGTDALRAFRFGGGRIVWDAYAATHEDVRDALGVKAVFGSVSNDYINTPKPLSPKGVGGWTDKSGVLHAWFDGEYFERDYGDVKTLNAAYDAFDALDYFDEVEVVEDLRREFSGAKPAQFSKTPTNIQAFVLDGKGYMIADNIAAGNEMAVFMHEIGAHIGLDGQEAQIMERVNLWSAAKEGSLERQVYDAMQSRMEAAGEVSESEQVAYAVEEAVKAGVTPKSVKMGMKLSNVKNVQDLVNWFAQHFKAAVDKMFKANTRGFNAQQLVDLAYGAARDAMQNQEVGAGKTAMSKEEPQFSIAAALPAQAQKYFGESGTQLWNDAAGLLRKGIMEATSLPDLVRQYEEKIPGLRKMYDALLSAQTRKIELDQEVDTTLELITNANLDKAQTKTVNDFLLNSTTEQKWGYDPKFKRKTTVDPEFAKKWAEIGKQPKGKEMQEIIRQVFQHGEDTMAKKRAVFESLGINDPFKRLTQLEGPYAPLRRFGKYMVEVKSPALVAEEAKQKDEEGGFKDTKRIDELKSDPENYRISFRPTIGAARKLYNDLMATGRYDAKNSIVGERPDAPYKTTEIHRSALTKVLAAAKEDDNVTPEIRAKMEGMIQDIYHQMMEDHLARQSMRVRKYRAGADENMLEAFAKQARAEAAFIANMENATKVNQATYQLTKERDTNRDAKELQDVVNMMINHRKRMLDFTDTPIQDLAVGMTSAWQLATSLGYHFANATQVAMKTVPMMAAEFGDYAGAWKHVTDGYKLFGQLKGDKFDWSKVQNKGLRETLETASKMNLIDVGMAEDFDIYNSPRTGYESADAALAKGRLALHKLRQVSRWVERANRVTAASAAFTMAKEKGKTDAEAQSFAIRVLEQTQGDFSQLAAPMIIKRLPKFITQYRKYQLMVAALYVRSFHEAFKGSTPAERAIGRRMLGYMLAHTAMVGGALGLPLLNIAEMVIPALFGDDDEPKDLERMMRDWLGDDMAADIVMKGLPSVLGLDLGSKLSDDRVFSILPYTDFALNKQGMKDALFGLMGPATGQAAKIVDGMALIKEGQIAQGVEKLQPKGIEDALKAYRIANEGYQLRNGDVLVKPEDINSFQIILQAVGMPPAELRRYQWIQGQQIEITKFYKERELRLKREYIDATKEGEDTTELEDKWMSLQDGKEKMRRYFGNQEDELKSKDLKLLREAPKKQQEREAKRQETVTQE